jgi:hypothetical protein
VDKLTAEHADRGAEIWWPPRRRLRFFDDHGVADPVPALLNRNLISAVTSTEISSGHPRRPPNLARRGSGGNGAPGAVGTSGGDMEMSSGEKVLWSTRSDATAFVVGTQRIEPSIRLGDAAEIVSRAMQQRERREMRRAIRAVFARLVLQLHRRAGRLQARASVPSAQTTGRIICSGRSCGRSTSHAHAAPHTR